MRITIKLKLGLAFAFIIVMVGAMAFLALDNINSLNGSISAMVKGPVADLSRIRDLGSRFNKSARDEKNAILSTEPAEIAGFVKSATQEQLEVQSDAARLKGSTNPLVVKETQDFDVLFEQLLPLRKQMLDSERREHAGSDQAGWRHQHGAGAGRHHQDHAQAGCGVGPDRRGYESRR